MTNQNWLLTLLIAVTITAILSVSLTKCTGDVVVTSDKKIDSLNALIHKKDSICKVLIAERNQALIEIDSVSKLKKGKITIQYIEVEKNLLALSPGKKVEYLSKRLHSTDTLPQMIVVNKDTIVAVKISQVDSINLTYNNLDKCGDLLKLSDSTSKEYRTLIDKGIVIENNLKDQLTLKDGVIGEKDTIIADRDKTIKKQKRKIIFLKIVKGAFMTTTAVVSILYLLK